MPKKIKSFTVDEDIYNGLVSMFKRYDTGVSVSLYINNRLRGLFEGLTQLERALKAYENFTVPMGYIINQIVNGLPKRADIEIPEKWDKEIRSTKEKEEEQSGDPEEYTVMELEEYQTRYDAEKAGVPYELFKYTVHGTFELSKDKRYLIHKRTGEQFFPVGDSLMQLVEPDDKKE